MQANDSIRTGRTGTVPTSVLSSDSLGTAGALPCCLLALSTGVAASVEAFCAEAFSKGAPGVTFLPQLQVLVRRLDDHLACGGLLDRCTLGRRPGLQRHSGLLGRGGAVGPRRQDDL